MQVLNRMLFTFPPPHTPAPLEVQWQCSLHALCSYSHVFSGAHPAAELADLLREWQASLGDCSTAASFDFALRLFHGIVRHLFLRHLEVLASTHYDLACDRRWYKLQPSNLKVRSVVGVLGICKRCSEGRIVPDYCFFVNS